MAQVDVTAPRTRLFHQAGLRRRQPVRAPLVGLVTIAAALLLWYVLTSLTGIISSYRFPSPPEFFAALRQIAVDGYAGGTLLLQTLQSLKIVVEGFLVACLVGVPLGFLMGWSPRAEALLNPVFLLIRPIPPLAWIPLAIVWLGLGDGAKIMVIWFAAFVPCVINTFTGVRQVNPVLIEAARVHGATDWRVAKEVVAPAFLHELLAFPGRYDDQVDSVSQFLKWSSQRDSPFDLTMISASQVKVFVGGVEIKF